jgi:hypothetical protein
MLLAHVDSCRYLFLLQLKKYYESSEDAVPPLKLQPCITASGENVYLAEPLVKEPIFLDLYYTQSLYEKMSTWPNH